MEGEGFRLTRIFTGRRDEKSRQNYKRGDARHKDDGQRLVGEETSVQDVSCGCSEDCGVTSIELDIATP